MRTVIMVKHGFKTKNGHITRECREEIQKNGIPNIGIEVNRIHKGSAHIGTFETAELFREWLSAKGGKIKLPLIKEDARLGSDELFERMATPEFREAVKSSKSNFIALKTSATTINFKDWSNNALKAIKDLFAQLENGDVCLSVTHSPIIEMIVNVCMDWRVEDLKLKELEGFRFMQASNGRISFCGLEPIKL